MSPPPVLERDLSSALKRGDHLLALIAGFPAEQRILPVLPDDLHPDDPETWLASHHAELVALLVWRNGKIEVLIRHEFWGQAWVEDALKGLSEDFMEHMAKNGFSGDLHYHRRDAEGG